MATASKRDILGIYVVFVGQQKKVRMHELAGECTADTHIWLREMILRISSCSWFTRDLSLDAWHRDLTRISRLTFVSLTCL